jgi:hypothetical protein
MRGPVLAGLLAAVSICGVAGAADPLSSSQRHVEKAGSVLQYAIPAAGLAATYFLDSQVPSDPDAPFWLMGRSPRHDLLMAIGRSWAVTAALKYSFNETRPDGGSRSFPSGHTSLSFTGAEFIRKEYGWSWGAPAYALAGFVGWSRVDAKKHYTHDVLAGAAIGILANHDFWRRDTPTSSARLAAAVLKSGHDRMPGLRLDLKFP